MGQQEGTRFSPSPLSYTLRPERLLVLALLAITLMFGVAYAQLFYQQRQALAARDYAATRVQEEMARQRDLEMLESLAGQPWYREAEAARAFGPRVPADPVVGQPEATSATAETAVSSPSPNVVKEPAWRQWMRAFHFLAPQGNREPR